MPGFFIARHFNGANHLRRHPKQEISIRFWASACEKSHACADQMRFEFEAIERNKAFAVFPLCCLRGAQPTNTL